MRKTYLSNEQILQDYGALFINLSKETELSQEMAEYGYDADKIAIGKKLYDKANEQYLKNKKEIADETAVALDYRKKLEQLTQVFANHRKRAKVVFKDQDEVLKKLHIKGTPPRNRAELIKEIEIFYTEFNNDETLLNAVKVMKIQAEQVTTQLEQVEKVQAAYASYLQEKGENQQATKDKNQAFAELEKWVRELYTVGKIALEDKPQLLESIAKFIRS